MVALIVQQLETAMGSSILLDLISYSFQEFPWLSNLSCVYPYSLCSSRFIIRSTQEHRRTPSTNIMAALLLIRRLVIIKSYLFGIDMGYIQFVYGRSYVQDLSGCEELMTIQVVVLEVDMRILAEAVLAQPAEQDILPDHHSAV
jgi:hypothetical protein